MSVGASSPRVPGPRLPAIIQSAWWFFGRFSFARACSKRYGRCFRIDLLSFGEVVVLTDPDEMREVLEEGGGALAAGEANSFGGLIEELAGSGSLLLRDGAEHGRLRTALVGAMAGLECDAEAQARAATRDSVGQWPRHRPFPLAPRLRRIAIEVFAASVLGLEQGRRGAAVTAIEEWTDRWNDPQVLLPFLRGGFGARWRWRRFLRARAAVLALLEAALGEPLRAESVAARLKADGELGDEEIRDQLMSLLAAGLHPTANGLSWALALLAGDPRSARLLRERLAAGDESYLDAVIEETLRLRPVGQWMARRVKRPYRLRSGGLAPGSLLIPNTFLAHHDPSLHPDPERFLPRRFLGDSRASRASIPFGSGPRRCPGEAIATAQLRGVLREVLAAVDLRLAGSRPERLATDGVNLVPKRGARVIVSDPS